MGSLNNPLQLKFKTDRGNYLYDGKTGRLYKMTPATYAIFDDFGVLSKEELLAKHERLYSPQEVQKGFKILEELSQTGLMLSGPLEQRLAPLDVDQVWHLLNHDLKKISIELTQACNLRCRYCVYSGGYAHYRTHGREHISEELAKAAIDFYATRAASDDFKVVSFYGGEPLVNFPLLRNCIEYVKSHPLLGPETLMNFTTNGTLLGEPVIDYLVENGVGVTISIDGPREHHDRYRVFPDGRGSFETTFKNIQNLRQRSQDDYYKVRVLFICVITPSSDLLDLYEFFAEHQDLFTLGRLRVTSVNEGNSEFLEQLQKDQQKFKSDLLTLRQMYVDTLLKRADYSLSFMQEFFEEDLLQIEKRIQSNEAANRINVIPTCLPGEKRLYATMDGTLHICERLGNHSFPIGTVQDGFDRNQIEALLEQVYQMANAEPCLNCWAVLFCDACYQRQTIFHPEPIRTGPFIHPSTTSYCQRTKTNKINHLQLYCEMREQNDQVFEFFDHYYIR